jgi:peroxiredoxin Q/BCP
VLKVGDRAPNFTGKDQNGNDFSLSELIGKKNIVLYFYPKDFSRGCTIETRSFSWTR